MRKFLCLFAFLAPAYGLLAQDVTIEAETDAFYKLIAADTEISSLPQEFRFTEGPLWSDDGYLLFSDIPANIIYKWVPGDSAKPHISPSGNSNGLSFDPDGNLLACEHGTRTLTKYTVKGDKIVLASHYNGKKLNSPNDLAVHSSGAIFFTDPPWGLQGNFTSEERELMFNGVFLLKDGTLHVVDSTLKTPNGIALSPDEKYLYVGNTQFKGDIKNMGDGKRSWIRYTLNDELEVTDKVDFIDNPLPEISGTPDGMKVDEKGNLYCTAAKSLLVFSPEGEYLGRVAFPGGTTNVAFGGPDGKTLYVTAGKKLYYFPALVKGI